MATTWSNNHQPLDQNIIIYNRMSLCGCVLHLPCACTSMIGGTTRIQIDSSKAIRKHIK